MEKFKEYKYIILVLVIILGVVFYWFQIRPTQIRKECMNSILLTKLPGGGLISGGFSVDDFVENYKSRGGVWTERNETSYKNCLRAKGLEK